MNEARPGVGSEVVTIRRPLLPRPAAVVMILGAVVFGGLAVTKGILPQTVRWSIACTRSAPKVGSCTITHGAAAFGAPERRTVDLASIEAVKEIDITGKGGGTIGARVVLKTSSGDVDTSQPHATQADADAVKKYLQRFVEDGTQPSLSRETQAPAMANWLLIAVLFGLFPLAISTFVATRSSRLVVDRSRGVVRLTSLVSPFSSKTVELPLDQVANAVVEGKEGRGRSRGTMRRVSIVTVTGTRFAFGLYTNDSQASVEATARAIDAALTRARG